MAELAYRFDDGAAYELFMGRWSQAAGSGFLDWLAAPRNAHWLDVGCGTGVFTRLILDRCHPVSVSAVDPGPAQIDHALRQDIARRASFQVADAQSLPFGDGVFDVVASALVLNFIPDLARALAEKRRVARPGGQVAGYVWDFAAERSPSWPLRLGMRQCGVDVPGVPGARGSSLEALGYLFERARCEGIATTTIEVTVAFADFDQFWQAQTPSYSPIANTIAAMTENDRLRLIEAVRTGLPNYPDGRIEYSARANAVKASMPG
jgi:ubiquinone/menaquinone biosynthesis C-methylase UbiE